jgi:hypothetical protein
MSSFCLIFPALPRAWSACRCCRSCCAIHVEQRNNSILLPSFPGMLARILEGRGTACALTLTGEQAFRYRSNEPSHSWISAGREEFHR